MKQIYQLLLIVALFASAANAQTEIEGFVDTDVAPGGIGSVEDPWNTMAVAEAVLDDNPDLVGDNKFITLNCIGSANDTTAVSWASFTTDATRFINILCDGEYSLVINDATALTISNTEHLRIDNINIEVSAITGVGLSVFRIQGVVAGNDLRITNSILKGPDNDALEFSIIRNVDTDAILTLNNVLIYDAGQNSLSKGIYIDAQGGTIYGYNCTIANCRIGVIIGNHATALFTGKNTIVSDSVGAAYTGGSGAGTMTLDYSASDDADPGNIGGANNVWGATPNYLNLFEITESTWVGKGTDISEEAQWFVDSDTDYYGTVRGVRGGWDIGYYEFPSSGSLSLYYRRLLERE